MAFVPITNTCSVELRMTLLGQRVALNLAFYKSSGIGGTDLQTIAEHCANWWNTAGKPLMSSGVIYRETYARDLTSSSAPSYTSPLHSGVVGTLSAGGHVPPNVAFCVSFRSSGRGRANRGRNYWFGIGKSQVATDSSIVTTYRNSIIAAYARFLPGGASDPTPWRWVIASRQLNGITVGRAVPIISVTTVDDWFDSQRRRLQGRGL